MSGANAAALEQAQLSREQLDWIKGVYEQERPAREAAAARAQAVSDAQVKSMQQQDDISKAAYDHYSSTFKPIESAIATEAMNYDTPERRAQASGQAMADVGTQADIAREGMVRDLASRGVDAGSGNVVAALARGGVQEAAAKAAAGNAATQQVETVGRALKADAANLGRGIASSQGTTAGLALTAGTQAAGNAQTALNATTSGNGMVQQGYSTAINGIGQSANTLTNIGKVQADGSGDQLLGAVAGAATRWGLGKI
jgi:hypothetical protein